MKVVFVQVIWKYKIGLHNKNDRVSTCLAFCSFPVVLTGLIAAFLVDKYFVEHLLRR